MEKSKIPALQRTIAILDLIASKGECSAADCIEELQIPKSSVYILLEELKKYRLIAQNERGHYHLWLKLVELAEHTLSGLNIREIAKPHLTELMHECNLLCHLGILDEQSAYYILKVESNSTISVRSYEGKRLSLYKSGIGKCLLAWQPETVRETLINNMVFEKTTSTTITSQADLRKELAQIREQGWSYDDGEDFPGVRCVAAPVFNARGELAAAISIVGTSLQIKSDDQKELSEKVIYCAQKISQGLGWLGR